MHSCRPERTYCIPRKSMQPRFKTHLNNSTHMSQSISTADKSHEVQIALNKCNQIDSSQHINNIRKSFSAHQSPNRNWSKGRKQLSLRPQGLLNSVSALLFVERRTCEQLEMENQWLQRHFDESNKTPFTTDFELNSMEINRIIGERKAVFTELSKINHPSSMMRKKLKIISQPLNHNPLAVQSHRESPKHSKVRRHVRLPQWQKAFQGCPSQSSYYIQKNHSPFQDKNQHLQKSVQLKAFLKKIAYSNIPIQQKTSNTKELTILSNFNKVIIHDKVAQNNQQVSNCTSQIDQASQNSRNNLGTISNIQYEATDYSQGNLRQQFVNTDSNSSHSLRKSRLDTAPLSSESTSRRRCSTQFQETPQNSTRCFFRGVPAKHNDSNFKMVGNSTNLRHTSGAKLFKKNRDQFPVYELNKKVPEASAKKKRRNVENNLPLSDKQGNRQLGLSSSHKTEESQQSINIDFRIQKKGRRLTKQFFLNNTTHGLVKHRKRRSPFLLRQTNLDANCLNESQKSIENEAQTLVEILKKRRQARLLKKGHKNRVLINLNMSDQMCYISNNNNLKTNIKHTQAEKIEGDARKIVNFQKTFRFDEVEEKLEEIREMLGPLESFEQTSRRYKQQDQRVDVGNTRSPFLQFWHYLANSTTMNFDTAQERNEHFRSEWEKVKRASLFVKVALDQKGPVCHLLQEINDDTNQKK